MDFDIPSRKGELMETFAGQTASQELADNAVYNLWSFLQSLYLYFPVARPMAVQNPQA
ncbi:MAG: hypothetical protein KBA71_09465 [Opitutaceae bacterium]|nr:hypothetical protein [Opitutaceae bacterium]